MAFLYAHSTEKIDCSDWEPLSDHLIEVASLAQKFAGRFDGGKLAEAAGLLHDIGKAKPAFQRKLNGEINSETHSGEGAKYACDAQSGLKLWGKLLAYVIAGHHSGLPNGKGGSGSLTPLDVRLKRTEFIDLPSGLPQPAYPQVHTTPHPLERSIPGTDDFHFSMQFFTRMLFSSLVDSDRLATEAFYNKIEGKRSQRGWEGEFKGLLEALDRKMATFAISGSSVNTLRQNIHNYVRANTKQSPGLFSLTVPTGGGKTLTSLAFALEHALHHDLRRVIYVIPYTSIIEQTALVFANALDDDDAILEHHTSFDWQAISQNDEIEKIKVATQNWDRPIVVTTTVQFFESLFSNRPSKCRKLHNISGSVIILDEAQTLPLRLLRPCLAAIRELGRSYNCSLVMCTATQPSIRKTDGFQHPEGLEDVRELAPNPKDLYERLRRVKVKNVGDLTDDALIEKIGNQNQVLVIVNNRRHARSLFDAIATEDGSMHLTNNMTSIHRHDVLNEVRKRLKNGSAIKLIATSLVEAGVDVDFPIVWRAIAGLDSIAQAAGRCNREGRLGQDGQVFVFNPITEHKPPMDLLKLIEVSTHVLSRFADDPLSIDALSEYFNLLYGDLSYTLDFEKVGSFQGIITAIGKAGNNLDYPFEDISNAFQMISEGAFPIINWAGPYGLPQSALKDIGFNTNASFIARKFQAYQVQVPFHVRNELLNAGAAEYWRSSDFGDQFVRLTNIDIYDDRAGLRWDSFEELGFQSL